MNRSTFIKRLTAAAIGIVIAKPIIDALPKPIQRSYIHGTSKFVASIDPISPEALVQNWIRKYPLTPDEVFFKEVMESYPKRYYDTELFSPKPIIYDNDDGTTPS